MAPGAGINAASERAAILVPPLIFTVASVLCVPAILVSEGLVSSMFLLSGLLGAAVLMAAPRPFLPILFLCVVFLGHLHRSPLTHVQAGVEWHPREALLLLLLGYVLWQFLLGSGHPMWHPAHAWILLYAAAFLLPCLSGLAQGHSIWKLFEELRFPVFLLAYPALLWGLQSRKDLWKCLALLLVFSGAAALASIIVFFYTWHHGLTFTAHNFLGEYVQRQAFGHMLQSIRPAPHLWMEVAVPVTCALLLDREQPHLRRALLLLLLLLLLAAHALSFMRTAYVSIACSLAIVCFLQFPPRAQVLLTLAAILLAAAAAVSVPLVADPSLLRPQEWEVSLRARLVETTGALELIAAHPITGAGFGSSFESVGYVSQRSQDIYGPASYDSLHNFWLYLLMKGGLASLCLALLGIGGIAACMWTVARATPNATDRLLLQGLLAGLLAQCLASLTMARLNYPAGHVLLAFSAAVAATVAARRPAPEAIPIAAKETP